MFFNWGISLFKKKKTQMATMKLAGISMLPGRCLIGQTNFHRAAGPFKKTPSLDEVQR
jgi:hypothetical protein